MLKPKVLTVIGAVATGLGAISTIVSAWVGDKQLDNKVADRVSKEITKRFAQK